jgi:hypothetical protein
MASRIYRAWINLVPAATGLIYLRPTACREAQSLRFADIRAKH